MMYSVIKIHGHAILPPLISQSQRNEIRRYQAAAVEIEKYLAVRRQKRLPPSYAKQVFAASELTECSTKPTASNEQFQIEPSSHHHSLLDEPCSLDTPLMVPTSTGDYAHRHPSDGPHSQYEMCNSVELCELISGECGDNNNNLPNTIIANSGSLGEEVQGEAKLSEISSDLVFDDELCNDVENKLVITEHGKDNVCQLMAPDLEETLPESLLVNVPTSTLPVLSVDSVVRELDGSDHHNLSADVITDNNGASNAISQGEPTLNIPDDAAGVTKLQGVGGDSSGDFSVVTTSSLAYLQSMYIDDGDSSDTDTIHDTSTITQEVGTESQQISSVMESVGPQQSSAKEQEIDAIERASIQDSCDAINIQDPVTKTQGNDAEVQETRPVMLREAVSIEENGTEKDGASVEVDATLKLISTTPGDHKQDVNSKEVQTDINLRAGGWAAPGFGSTDSLSLISTDEYYALPTGTQPAAQSNITLVDSGFNTARTNDLSPNSNVANLSQLQSNTTEFANTGNEATASGGTAPGKMVLRSKSFTLESPSPVLMQAFQDRPDTVTVDDEVGGVEESGDSTSVTLTGRDIEMFGQMVSDMERRQGLSGGTSIIHGEDGPESSCRSNTRRSLDFTNMSLVSGGGGEEEQVIKPVRCRLVSEQLRYIQAKVKNVSDPARFHTQCCLLSATAKGYLTRKLYQTSKVQRVVKSITDIKAFMQQLYCEMKDRGGRMCKQDKQLMDGLIIQYQSEKFRFYDIFFTISTAGRMLIIDQDRLMHNSSGNRSQDRDDHDRSGDDNKKQQHSKVSQATLKVLERREYQRSHPAPQTADANHCKPRRRSEFVGGGPGRSGGDTDNKENHQPTAASVQYMNVSLPVTGSAASGGRAPQYNRMQGNATRKSRLHGAAPALAGGGVTAASPKRKVHTKRLSHARARGGGGTFVTGSTYHRHHTSVTATHTHAERPKSVSRRSVDVKGMGGKSRPGSSSSGSVIGKRPAFKV